MAVPIAILERGEPQGPDDVGYAIEQASRALKPPNRGVPQLSSTHEPGVPLRPLSWRLLPLSSGEVAAAGHPQQPAQPGDGVLTGELIDQAKPLGGSCSFAICAAASLKKSLSLLNSSFSLRSRLSTARSSLVSRF